MGQIKTFRDPDISLWQSAVDEVVSQHNLAQRTVARGVGAEPPPRPDLSDPMLAKVAELGRALEEQQARGGAAAERGLLSGLQGAAAGVGSFFSQVKAEAQQAAQPLLNGAMDLAQFRQRLFTRFSTHDPRWVEAAVEYTKHFVLRREQVPYRRHSEMGDFVIDGRLPAKARVAFIADWGTGQPEAFDVLQQVANKEPNVVIHLGDIYYSGTESEVRNAFFEPCQRILQPPVTGCTIFNLCGNHDVYSGGQPYYELLNLLGQPASYFCLRNDHWQFIAMDTGLNSHDLLDTSATHVEDSEVAWIKDKLAHAQGRKSILLSHHQPFSAYEPINGQAANRQLLDALHPELEQASLWLWGHEHTFVVYQPYEGIRGRCIGHGAIPVEFPREAPRVRFDDVPRVETTLGNHGGFFNHGYAILQLDGAKGHIAYYQDSDESQPVYQEDV